MDDLIVPDAPPELEEASQSSGSGGLDAATFAAGLAAAELDAAKAAGEEAAESSDSASSTARSPRPEAGQSGNSPAVTGGSVGFPSSIESEEDLQAVGVGSSGSSTVTTPGTPSTPLADDLEGSKTAAFLDAPSSAENEAHTGDEDVRILDADAASPSSALRSHVVPECPRFPQQRPLLPMEKEILEAGWRECDNCNKQTSKLGNYCCHCGQVMDESFSRPMFDFRLVPSDFIEKPRVQPSLEPDWEALLAEHVVDQEPEPKRLRMELSDETRAHFAPPTDDVSVASSDGSELSEPPLPNGETEVPSAQSVFELVTPSREMFTPESPATPGTPATPDRRDIVDNVLLTPERRESFDGSAFGGAGFGFDPDPFESLLSGSELLCGPLFADDRGGDLFGGDGTTATPAQPFSEEKDKGNPRLGGDGDAPTSRAGRENLDQLQSIDPSNSAV